MIHMKHSKISANKYCGWMLIPVLVLIAVGAHAKPKKSEVMNALKKYSPSGYYIVSTYDKLPESFNFYGSKLEMKKPCAIMDFFESDNPERFVEDMVGCVHEINHFYTTFMAYKIVEDTGAEFGSGAEAIYVNDKPILVNYTKTFPARDMDADFPEAAKTFRYKTYISPSEESQSTQIHGVYGLLDEFNAYYHTARTVVDFWGYIKDRDGKDLTTCINYFSLFNNTWVSYADFKLFILKYLIYAKKHDTEVYGRLTGNENFKNAFLKVEKEFAGVLAEAEALKKEIFAHLRDQGYEVEEKDRSVRIGDTEIRTFSNDYLALKKELDKEDCAAMMKTLEGRPAGPRGLLTTPTLR